MSLPPTATRRARAFTASAAPQARSHAPADAILRPFANNDASVLKENEGEEGDGISRDSITISNGAALRRFEALEDLLTTRPTRDTLIDRNILKNDQVSSRITAAQEQLRKQLIEDALKTQIESRPQLKDLVDHNIIKQENDKKFNLTKEELDRKLSERKKPVDLVQANILQPNEAIM